MNKFSDPISALAVAHNKEMIQQAEAHHLAKLARSNKAGEQQNVLRYINNTILQRNRSDKAIQN